MQPNIESRSLTKSSYNKLRPNSKLKLRLKSEKRLFNKQKRCAAKKNGKRSGSKKSLQRLRQRKKRNVCDDVMRLKNLSEKKFACSMKKNFKRSGRKRLASVKLKLQLQEKNTKRQLKLYYCNNKLL